MKLDQELIKNKQRILIGGNYGAGEIFNLVKRILTHVNKSADFLEIGSAPKLSDAPIIIMKGGDELENGQALFQNLDIHILLVHGIKEELPDGYGSFEEYVTQYEALADSLPKAGIYLFFEDNDVATLMGKKEREDVKNIEYASLKGNEAPNLKDESLAFAAGAKALLNRIGVSDEQFFTSLKTL